MVDLNRQSLDRVVPDIAFGRWAHMFEAAGWQTITVKYGRRLDALFERPGRPRAAAPHRRDAERGVPAPAARRRPRSCASGCRTANGALTGLVAELDDGELRAGLRDLGGHDLGALIDAYRRVEHDRPTVVFAYTIKGWSLPIEGHPENHSALLTRDQMLELAEALGADADDPWAGFDAGSPEGELCAAAATALAREEPEPVAPPAVPTGLGRKHRGQGVDPAGVRPLLRRPRARRARGGRAGGDGEPRRGQLDQPRRLDQQGRRSGRWASGATGSPTTRRRSSTGTRPTAGATSSSASPRPTWSGCSASSAPPGAATASRCCRSARSTTRSSGRALEPWSFGIYAGGQSILVGTPSGVSLAPEGGAHQSIVTPSIGIGQPGCTAWEPAFGQDLEWTLLHALSRLGRPGGESAYFRLSTRPIDQALAGDAERRPPPPGARRRLSAPACAGAPARDARRHGRGACPEVIAGRRRPRRRRRRDLPHQRRPALPRAARPRRLRRPRRDAILDELLPADRAAPLVTVLDGDPARARLPGGGQRHAAHPARRDALRPVGRPRRRLRAPRDRRGDDRRRGARPDGDA